jgi:hypothetical protein
LALDPTLCHKYLTAVGGEKDANHVDDKNFVCSKLEYHQMMPMSQQACQLLIQTTWLDALSVRETGTDVQCFCEQIVGAIIDKDAELKRDPDHIRLLWGVDGETDNYIYSYNQFLEFIERDKSDIERIKQQMCWFCRISTQQGYLQTSDGDYSGSMYNVIVERKSRDTNY